MEGFISKLYDPVCQPPPPRVRVNEIVDSINKRVSPTTKNKDDKSTANTVNNKNTNTNTNKRDGFLPPPPPPRVPPGFQPRGRSRNHSFSFERPDRPRSHSREQDSSRRQHSRERPSVWGREFTHHHSRHVSGGVPFQGPSQPQ